MLQSPVKMYFSIGRAPVYGDTWAPIDMERPRKIYTWADDLCKDKSIKESLKHLEKGGYLRKEGVSVFPGFRAAISKWGDWELAIKSGYNDAGHVHPDIGSIILLLNSEEIADDLGSTGYASEMFKWNRSPMSHNTVVVDNTFEITDYIVGRKNPGKIKTTKDSILIEGIIAGNCKIRRFLKLNHGKIEDTTNISCEKPRKFTWFMYLNHPIKNIKGEPESRRFKDIHFVSDAVLVKNNYSFDNGKVNLALDAGDGPASVYSFVSPGNKLVAKRYGIAWDKEGLTAEFKAVWSCSKEA